MAAKKREEERLAMRIKIEESFKENCVPALRSLACNIVIPEDYTMVSKEKLDKTRGFFYRSMEDVCSYYSFDFYQGEHLNVSLHTTISEEGILHKYFATITKYEESLIVLFPKGYAYWEGGYITPAAYILVSFKNGEYKVLFTHIDPAFQRKGE